MQKAKPITSSFTGEYDVNDFPLQWNPIAPDLPDCTSQYLHVCDMHGTVVEGSHLA